MSLTDRGRTYLLIALLSLVFSYLIVTPNGYPHFGLAASLITFAVLSYKLKKEKSKNDKRYFILSLIFSILLFIRSESTITFFNFWGAFVFGVFLLTPFQGIKLKFIDHVIQPALYLMSSFFGKSGYFLEFNNDDNEKLSVKVVETLVGVMISIILLAVILPILSTVNPFFENIVNDLWSALDITHLLESIGYELIYLTLFRLVLFLGFIFMLPKLLTFMNKKIDLALPIELNLKIIPLTIPKLVVAVTLVVFFVTQLQYYLASDRVLLEMGISHSERVNEVFGQLSFIAGVVLILIYNSKHKKKLNGALNYLLGVQGAFLAFMAYKSDFDYINAWGLTYKRLYGLFVATWILGIFILLFKNHIKEAKPALFIKNSILYSAVILILINVFNFDYVIYHFSKATTGEGVDYTYLSRLSPDSLSYKEQFNILENNTYNSIYRENKYDNEDPLILISNIERLQERYKSPDLRTVSVLELIEYRNVRNIDTDKLRNFYSNSPASSK